MKKNKMMRLASFLLIAVLVSTSAISGTYAKYVSKGTAEDEARVAKWGVTVTGVGKADETMFKENYNDTAISSETGVDIVAPGTSGSLANFTVSGTPEVAVKVEYVADLVLTGWEVVGVTTYCPIVFTVAGTEYKMDMGGDVTAFETQVENAIKAVTNNYAAKTDLNVVGDDLVVTWAWPYEGNDGADTALGDQAANGNAATIKLTVTCTVTQID